MVTLMDANVLIAFLFADHEHHRAVVRWWGDGRGVSTCPITEGALVRYALRVGLSVPEILELFGGLVASEHHHRWGCDVHFDADVLSGVVGHRQVTDAYLVALARSEGGSLATFDRSIAELRPGLVELLVA